MVIEKGRFAQSESVLKDKNNCREKKSVRIIFRVSYPNIVINIKMLINIKMNIDGENPALYIFCDHILYQKSQYKFLLQYGIMWKRFRFIFF